MTSQQPTLPPSRRGAGWPLLAALGVGIIALVATWFAITGPLNSDEEQSYRYVEAIIGSPSRVNPLFAYLNEADRDIASLVFSALTRLGPDGSVLPDLAESWEVSADGVTVTFHLRPNVLWHTGVPFTSDDVLYTYSLLANPNVQSEPDQANLWRQITCLAPDELTVACVLPEPFAPFLAYATSGILPRHVLEAAEPQSLIENSFNQAPVGTGPYRLVQMDQTQAILKPNAQYYFGPPLLDELNFRFYPDSATAVAAIVRGEAQGIFLDSVIAEADFETISSLDGLSDYSASRSSQTVLFLNNSKPPLNDAAVRKAIASAVDVESLIADVLAGRAIPAESPIPSGTWAHNPDIDRRDHDVNEARRLLEDAGWTLPEGGDVRLRNQVELRLTLVTDRDSTRSALAEAIAGQLAEIGVAATVVQEDSGALLADVLAPREYQAAIVGWDPGIDPDPYPAWHSSQTTAGGRNLAGYESADADALMEQARRTNDLDERQRLYYTFQETFNEDVPSITLFHAVDVYFITSQIDGVELGVLFSNASRFQNIEEWAFKTTSDLRD